MPLNPSKHRKWNRFQGAEAMFTANLSFFFPDKFGGMKLSKYIKIRIYCVSYSINVVLNLQGKFCCLHHFWIAMSPARSKSFFFFFLNYLDCVLNTHLKPLLSTF